MNRSTPLTRSRCGKRRYPSLTAAEAALSKIRRDGLRDAAPVRAYDCARCGGAHLTSQPKPAGRDGGGARHAGDPTAKTRGLVLARAGFGCERCGTAFAGGAWSLHHRTPRGAGGTSDPASASPCNLVALCGTGTTGCHGWAESHRALAVAAGWLVPRGTDPATVPVTPAHSPPVLLDPDGGYTPMPTSAPPTESSPAYCGGTGPTRATTYPDRGDTHGTNPGTEPARTAR